MIAPGVRPFVRQMHVSPQGRDLILPFLQVSRAPLAPARSDRAGLELFENAQDGLDVRLDDLTDMAFQKLATRCDDQS